MGEINDLLPLSIFLFTESIKASELLFRFFRAATFFFLQERVISMSARVLESACCCPPRPLREATRVFGRAAYCARAKGPCRGALALHSKFVHEDTVIESHGLSPWHGDFMIQMVYLLCSSPGGFCLPVCEETFFN